LEILLNIMMTLNQTTISLTNFVHETMGHSVILFSSHLKFLCRPGLQIVSGPT
jgi:hypothetical protein